MGSDSTELSARPRLADLIVKAGRVYSMNDHGDLYAALAVRDGWIVATSADPDGLDELASEGTRTIDDSELTLLPALSDAVGVADRPMSR
jgi:predicted amidohydrolase YtcJ